MEVLSTYYPLTYAQLAQDIFPVSYQTDSYCVADFSPIIPHSTPKNSQQLVKDLACIKQQLATYQTENQPTKVRYYAFKAQAWLSYVQHEDSEKGLTKSGTYALNEALSILKALQTNQIEKLPQTADIPPPSGLKRADLWAKILTLKQYEPAFAKIPKEIAFAEVKLMWAEAEFCEFGWRHSREHFGASERFSNMAEITGLNALNPDEKTRYLNLYATIYDKLKLVENNNQACHGTVFANPPSPT